jgi:hypothetical protein
MSDARGMQNFKGKRQFHFCVPRIAPAGDKLGPKIVPVATDF